MACTRPSSSWFSFGVLFPFLFNEFQESLAATSMVQAVSNGVNQILGPVNGLLVAKHGHRPMGISGPSGIVLAYLAAGLALHLVVPPWGAARLSWLLPLLLLLKTAYAAL